MKGKIWYRLSGILLLLLLGMSACGFSSGTTSSRQDPALPRLSQQDRGWVDPTGRVKSGTLEALRQESDVFETEGFQLAGVFFADVVSDPSKIASDFGNQNGIGSANKDNGLVILVLLDRAGTDGNTPYIFVAPGKGLEGLLNDARVTRFREAFFNPLRAQGKWEQGLIQLCEKFAEYLKNPEARAFSDESLSQSTQSSQMIPPWIIVLLIPFLFFFIFLILRYARRSGWGGNASGGGPWNSGSSGGGSYGGGGSFGGGGSGG